MISSFPVIPGYSSDDEENTTIQNTGPASEEEKELTEEEKFERGMVRVIITTAMLFGLGMIATGIYFVIIPWTLLKSECSYEEILSMTPCATKCSQNCKYGNCPTCTGERVTFGVYSSHCSEGSPYIFTSRMCFLSTPNPVGSGTCTLQKDDPCASDSLQSFDDPLNTQARTTGGDESNDVLVQGIMLLLVGSVALGIAGLITKFYFFPSKEDGKEDGKESASDPQSVDPQSESFTSDDFNSNHER